jgi:hypothetical protein
MKKSSIKFIRIKFLCHVLLALVMAITLLACGSSGGGTDNVINPDTPPNPVLLTGVAATGKAIIGNVYLKDSEGTVLGPEPIAGDGSFSFDVYGLVPPFYLVADDGSGNRLYSVTMSSGIANINPFTNILVAAAAGVSDPAEVYNNPDLHPITQENIEEALNELRNKFLPLLWEYDADINFITDPFVANHTGPDKLFDNLSVEILSGIVSVSDGQGNPLGKFHAESLQNVSSSDIQIYGNGFNEPEPGFIARLSLDVDGSTLSLSDLTFAYQLIFFSSTSVTSVSHLGNDITITGEGEANGLPGYSFIAVISDGNPDAMGIEIREPDGSVLLSTSNQDTTGGGFTVIII